MHSIDESILLGLAKLRSPLLNRAMSDISSLGSSTVIALISVTAFSLLWIARDHRGAVRVVTAAAGAEIWLEILKLIFGRPRPTLVPYLVEFTGWSFPSGHALVATATYVTLAAVLSSHMKERRGRTVIRSMCATIVALVAISRIYLGIHYPSDVAGGVLLGMLWFYVTAIILRQWGA
jgi:undecaprenyl-diphosphatase